MPEMRTFYDELGIDRDAGSSDIKRAFKDSAKVYHPDMNPPDKKDWAHEQMSHLNFIVETLLNSETRAEYDDLVDKYERGFYRRPRRTPRQEYALQREYARIGVEIMNLRGRYSNCRLKMVIGGVVFVFSVIVGVAMTMIVTGSVAYFYISFARFFALVGAMMVFMGSYDYVRRGRYRKDIRELEARQFDLRRRMYEAWTAF